MYKRQEEYEENKNKQKGEWENLTGVKLLWIKGTTLSGFSMRTLQTYRDNHTLPYTQIGYKMYYKPEDIERLIEQSASP